MKMVDLMIRCIDCGFEENFTVFSDFPVVRCQCQCGSLNIVNIRRFKEVSDVS